MTTDPQVTALMLNLGALAARNTASAVTTKIAAIRVGKQHDAQVAELVDVVNELLADRGELVGIAQGLQETLVAQQISEADIHYIVETIIPTIKRLTAQKPQLPSSSSR